MKLVFALLTTIALSGIALAADEHDHKPRFGGIVSEVKEVQYELVAKPDTLQIYISDHGKAIKADGASGKVTLLSAAGKQDVELKPAGDKLEAKGTFKIAAGTKAIASITLPGKGAVNVSYTIK